MRGKRREGGWGQGKRKGREWERKKWERKKEKVRKDGGY